MTHVITSLCVRDNSCLTVCPVECILPGNPTDRWPNYYIDPATCIDCGACVRECPVSAIFPEEEVPSAYQAKGGEIFNHAGLNGRHERADQNGKPVTLETTRALFNGETVDLTESIQLNRQFFKQ